MNQIMNLWFDIIDIIIQKGLPFYEAIQEYWMYIFGLVVIALASTIALRIIKFRR